MKKNIRNAIAASVSAMALICAANATDSDSDLAAADNGVAIQWNIPAQPLTDALIAWSEQSNYVILIEDELTAGIQSPELIGAFTSFEALERLLAASGLTYKIRDNETLIVAPRLRTASLAYSEESSDAASSVNPRPIRIAQADDQELSNESDREDSNRTNQGDRVVVTGTRISGAPPAAPLRTITREEIDRSGQSQIGEFLRTVPQNFPGGSNRGVQGTPISDDAANQSGATTINLRGLGPDATLVLVNGHRLASDNLFGGPDVSVIPVTAIERLEIVTDGASAVYGSDAVAGVANFVLRSDYRGAEASARVGGATQGGGFEQTYNVMGGHAWATGHVLAGFEYLEQEEILSSEREFTSSAPPRNRLLPPQERASAFFTGHQDLTGAVRLDLTALYTDRSTEFASEVALPGLASTLFGLSNVDVESYLIAPRLSIDLGEDWTANLDGVIGLSDNNSTTATSLGSVELSVGEDAVRNKTNSIEFDAQGALFDFGTGALRLAAGGGYRKESQRRASTSVATNPEAQRDVRFAFAEALIPLIARSAERVGLQELELSVAARFEDYSDFGDTLNPRVGIRYAPLSSLVLRGTWGESFKAPLFRQLATPTQVLLFPEVAAGGSGAGAVMIVSGGNPDLDPERSTSWTAGFDWSPGWADDLNLSLTYFNVDYEDRIILPFSSLGAVLSDPDLAQFVVLDPSAAQQAEAIASAADFFNNSGAPYDPATIVALAFSSFVNASAQEYQGVDVSIAKSFRFANSGLDLAADASWLDLEQRTLPTQDKTTLSGLIFRPAKWRARASATLHLGDLSSTAAVNYVSGSTDNFVTPFADVSSWTTLDLNFRYRLPVRPASFDRPEVSLSLTNVLDNDPPFAAGGAAGSAGMFFDSTNASPVGRFIAVTIRQAF